MKRFLVAAILLAGCGGGDDFGGGSGNVPAQALGQWSTSRVSGVSYTSGTSSDPSGVIIRYTFLDGGRYIFEFYDMSSAYTCSTTVYGRETGTAQFAESAFTLSPAAATLTSKSSCSSSWNYQRPWNERLDADKSHQWQMGTDPTDPTRRMLVVVDTDGSELDLREGG